MSRRVGRRVDELRPTTIETGVLRFAEGSSRITMGETVVLCAATVEDRVPPFLKGSGQGWVTAEYGMLPRSSSSRIGREAVSGRQGGRTLEIQRLIGRSLRPSVDLVSLGERTIILDCDVIEADGGTRTASITGACVALNLALADLVAQERIPFLPTRGLVAAVSVGVVDGEPRLDLEYEEDHRAEVDLNVVRTGGGRFIEIQGTAEKEPFTSEHLDRMLELGALGCDELVQLQKAALGDQE